MSQRNFRQMLEDRWASGTAVCVGLDSDDRKIPESARKGDAVTTILAFNRAIVDATKDLVCAFKPNAAFYEAHGPDGWLALEETIAYINRVAPEIPVILDAKRADIGNTNDGYVIGGYNRLNADAITVHPYLGGEAMKPFLDCKDKGVIVLCRTSNPGAGEFQDLPVKGMKLFEYIAVCVASGWNANKNCALVVGATYPEELADVRMLVEDMPILIPGIGAQGGDLEKTVAAGKDSRGRGMIINSSRGIIFASKGPDFADVARKETIKLRDGINACLSKEVA